MINLEKSGYHAIFFTDLAELFHAKTLGAYRLATELRRHGYRVLVLDYFGLWLKNKNDLFTVLKNAVGPDTLFVGYSGTFLTSHTTVTRWPVPQSEIKDLGTYIKNLNSKVKIIYGGSQSHRVNNDLFDCNIDYVIQGLADHAIIEFADSLSRNKTPKFSNSSNGIRIINHDAKGYSFNFKILGNTHFTEDDFVTYGETLPLEISRGCMFKCTFCSFPLLGRKKNDSTYLIDPATITKELAYNYEKFNITNYIITDDTFNESVEKLLTVKKAIDDSGVRIRFFSYLRADLMARFPEQADILLDMGIITASFGIETLNHQSGQAIGKGLHPDRVKQCLIDFKRKSQGQVITLGHFIVGLPHDTEKTLQEDFEWIESNKEFLDTYMIHSLELKPDGIWVSELASNPEKYGYTILNNGNSWVNKHMDSQTADTIAKFWMSRSNRLGRQNISSMQLMGALNYWYSNEEIFKMRYDNLPAEDIEYRNKKLWENYKQRVIDHVQ